MFNFNNNNEFMRKKKVIIYLLISMRHIEHNIYLKFLKMWLFPTNEVADRCS